MGFRMIPQTKYRQRCNDHQRLPSVW